MICQECNKEFDKVSGLHIHVSRGHNIQIADYYHKHYPRFDKWDNSPIPFKSYEQYHSTDFNSRVNFGRWCQKHPDKKEVENYCLNLLQKRKESKKLKFLPSQIESKGIMLPGPDGWKKVFGCWEDALIHISSIIPVRFKYNEVPTFYNGELEIFIDTREQHPLKFPNSKKMKLSCGDYGCGGSFYSDVFIERKSIPDLCGTLSSGISRFVREIERAAELGQYLVVVIEDSFLNLSQLSPENSFAKVLTGSHVLHNMREIMQEFDNIQFVFADNRQNATRLIEQIFRMKKQVRHFDLEYLKDNNLI